VLAQLAREVWGAVGIRVEGPNGGRHFDSSEGSFGADQSLGIVEFHQEIGKTGLPRPHHH